LQLIQDGYRNPAVYECAYECTGDKAALPGYLAAVRRIDPVLWAQWAVSLPRESVTAKERAEAEALVPKPLPDVLMLYLKAIGRESATGNIRRQEALTEALLRCNPFLPIALESLYRLYGGEGSRAAEMWGRKQRYLEARVENYFRVESRLGYWKIIPYGAQYHYCAMELGRMYEEKKDYPKALALYEKIEPRSAGFDPKAHWHRLIMTAQVKPSGAADGAVFRELDRPDVPVDLFALAARLYIERGAPGRAVLILTLALRHYPTDRALAYWLRTALNGFPPDRIPFDTLLAADLESPEYWCILAENLFQASRYEEGEKLVERALRGRPADPWLLYLKGFAAYQLERYSHAEEPLRQAFEQTPEYPTYGAWFARTLIRLNRFEEARAVLDRALAQSPGDAFLTAIKSELEQAQAGRK
jgi:tetratricopeptide (TPR) repeat protein